jgi:hypothetical protein
MFSGLCRVDAPAKEPKGISIIHIHVVSMRTTSINGANRLLCSKVTVPISD